MVKKKLKATSKVWRTSQFHHPQARVSHSTAAARGLNLGPKITKHHPTTAWRAAMRGSPLSQIRALPGRNALSGTPLRVKGKRAASSLRTRRSGYLLD
jgi:hypothetical protein